VAIAFFAALSEIRRVTVEAALASAPRLFK